MSSQLQPGQVVTGPDARVIGDVLAVFDAGDIGQVATVAWRHTTGHVAQYNVGVRWLTVLEGLAADPLAAQAVTRCSVCGTPHVEWDSTPDRYGTCGYGQCIEAAWPEHQYIPKPNRVDKPAQ